MYCGNTMFPLASKVKLPPCYNDLLTQELIIPRPQELEKSTRNQSQNPECFKYRAIRITLRCTALSKERSTVKFFVSKQLKLQNSSN